MNNDEIVSKLDIKSFFSKYGVAVTKERNQNCEGSCPFCRDEEHFSFNRKTGLWKCWKCKESGNLVGFLKKLGHDYKNAKKILQEEAGIVTDDRVIPLDSRQKKTSKTPNKDAGKVIDKPVIYRIYARVCELLPLTDIHRQQLKTKRGFTDETIDRLRFRSLGKHAAAIKDKLLAEFQEEDLVESGVLVKVNNQLIVNSQLLEDRVLIPYLGLARYVPTDGTGAMDDDNDAPGRPTGADSKNSTGAESASLRAGTSTTDGMGSEMVRQSELGRPTGAGSKNLGVKRSKDEVEGGILEEVEVYYIRPHKLGFERIAPQIYCRYFLQKIRPEHVVLTEGEFKATALWQWRIPAVAVPGISSFGAKHLDRLVALFREFGVKKVTVIFDNEIKDNPEYPNYKPKASDRYDTQLWSYLMAYKLGREGFDAKIGWLPDEWRERGKIDFDGALAQGRSREEVLQIIARAKTPREFLEDLDEEARRIVQRKISMHFTRLNIRREFNRYVVTRYRGGEAYDEVISNFVINIKSSFFTPDGVVRNVQFVNEYGEASNVFPLEPSEMAGPSEFKKFCFSKGNYIYKGKGDDLTSIWELELGRDTGEMVYMPDKIFQVEDDLWLTGNLAVKKGKVYLPDNDGIVWINGKGYKPQSLQVNTRGEATEDAIISLSTRPVDILDIAEKIRDCIGGYEAYVALGWVIACIFSRRIFEEYHCSPILFVHGRKESGKTTLMRWIMWFFGLDTEGFNLAETSQNFITRALAYYSGMGVWFDEYRNETRITQKDGFFRSAYNRQLSGKGTPTAFQARGFLVNACIAISGEELPKDSGLFTRCVPIQVSEYRRGRQWFEWLNKNCSDFSGFTYQLLLSYDSWAEKVLKNIADLKKALSSCGISDRTATNWAICAGAFDAVVKQDDGFIRWVEQACQEIRQAAESGHMLSLFWNDVSYLAAEKEVDDRYIQVSADGYMYIWLEGLYEKWALHYRKKTGREPFDIASIQKYLREEPCCISASTRYYFKGSRKRAWVLKLDDAPEVINDIADTVGMGRDTEE